MALPPTVRVKLSSEAAESISITPVVVQEMPVGELVEYMLGVTGKDEARIRELLLRGSLVSGASRFRWTGWDAGLENLRELLATFPDPDPSRPFMPAISNTHSLPGPSSATSTIACTITWSRCSSRRHRTGSNFRDNGR